MGQRGGRRERRGNMEEEKGGIIRGDQKGQEGVREK